MSNFNYNCILKLNNLTFCLKMGKLCCSTKDSEFARGPGKSKGIEDDEIDSIASHSMNVNDSLHLEYAKKLQA